MKYQIIYFGDKGTILSKIEERDDLTEGAWDSPFPNTTKESSAFGLYECISQSNIMHAFEDNESIVKIVIKVFGDDHEKVKK